MTPSAARRGRRRLALVGRMEIMRETQEQDAPCRVTEFVELEPMRVAACHVVGPEPEGKAWRKLSTWARSKGLLHEPGRAKVYGYNKPDRGANDDPATHGYELILAVPEEAEGSREIPIRTFPGGRYAALESTVRDVGRDWKRLALWLSTSEYEYDDRTQWLEEHVAMGRTEEEIRLKLLIPVRRR